MATLENSVSVARARRRPTRYSPELSASQQQSEMCFTAPSAQQPNGVIVTPEQFVQAELQDPSGQQTHVLQAVNGDMAPAAKRARSKPKKKYNKRRNAADELVNGKRPRVANVLLENEMLIDEIRARKALWMRTHEQHHSSVLTAPLWEEIAKVLDTTQENIRRRWKSLKDHYRRELKKSMTDATAPASVWPYYKKMKFMKSQMFVSLRRKNGEDHLEILSDDDEDVNNGWNTQIPRKQEGSDTMDDYELGDEYHEMVKFEQHMDQMQSEEMDGTQEEEEEEEDQQHQEEEEEETEENVETQEEMSELPSMQEQELLQQQQQADMSELTNMSAIEDQSVMPADMSTMTTLTEINGVPTMVTTNASSLSDRLSAMQQHNLSGRLSAMQQRNSELNAMQQSAVQQHNLNGEIADINARHSAIQQQRANANNRLSAIQRTAEMNAMQQRANISAMHQRAEINALQQRVEMQQRNGDDGSNLVSPIIGDERGGISDDYHFFMSLMPHVKNFSSLQKLKVRNRIQQIIIDEAQNCQYGDPLENC